MKDIFKQGLKFVGFSGIGWLIDTSIYLLLTEILGLDIDISNVISSFCGVSFVFLMSTRKIFENNSNINIKIKYVIYIIYQIILIFTASKVMVILKDYLINIDFLVKYVNIIVKILITPFTMVINFIVMKNLIEKL